MQFSFTNHKVYQLSYIVFALLISVMCLGVPDSCVFVGYDGSFRYALNVLYAHQSQHLANIQFPCGPLLFLKYPISFDNHLLLASCFELVARLLLCYYLWISVKHLVTKYQLIYWFGITVFFQIILGFDYLLDAVFLYAAICFYLNNNYWQYAIALLLFVLALFIKAGIAIPLMSIWCMLHVVLLYKGSFKKMLISLSITILLMLLLSIRVYGNISTAFLQLYSCVFMSFSYANEWVLYVPNNIFLLMASVMCILSVFVTSKTVDSKMIAIIVSGFLFVMFKYSMGRQDESHNMNWLYAIIVAMPAIIMASKNRKWVFVFGTLAFAFFSINTYKLYSKLPFSFRPMGLTNFQNVILKPKVNKKSRMAESIKATEYLKLNPALLQEIEKNEIDFYPFEIGIAFANNLNYKPRPCLQAYACGTYGDGLDSVQIASPQSANYILWHSTNAGRMYTDGLDEKHLQNECISSMQAIWDNYEIVNTDTPSYYLFKKRNYPLKRKIISNKKFSCRFNEFVSLPSEYLNSKGQVMLKCSWKKNIMLQLQSAIYKGVPFGIEYVFTDGSKLYYNITEQALHKGILINNLITNPAQAAKPIIGFKLVCLAKRVHTSTIEAQYNATEAN